MGYQISKNVDNFERFLCSTENLVYSRNNSPVYSLTVLFLFFFFFNVWLQSRAMRYQETHKHTTIRNVKYYSDHKINGQLQTVFFYLWCLLYFTIRISLASCYLSDIFNLVPNDRIEFVRLKSIFNHCQLLRQFKSCERSAFAFFPSKFVVVSMLLT